MNHTEKTKAQLQNELEEIRQQVTELKAEVIKSSRIMEQSPISIIITDTKGNIEYVNPKFTQVTGYTREEVIGKNPRILKSGEISPEGYKQLWETISSGDEWRGEFHNKKKNGELYWEYACISAIRDPQGVITHFFAVEEDITEKKHLDDLLRESEQRYALAAVAANDGLWDWDLEANVIVFSPRWKLMLGYEEGEIGKHPDEWFDRVHPDDVNQLKTEIEAHLKGPSPYFESEYRILDGDRNYCWMLCRGLALRNVEGKAYRMAGSQTDITVRKHAEERLQYNSFYDSMTGLPNRALFMDRLERMVEWAKRHKDYLFAVLFIDLDQFKLINDSFGHKIGDKLLTAVAQRIQACLFQRDTVARFGGDEFAILLNDIKEVNEVERITDLLHRELSHPFMIDGHEVFTSMSIGVVLNTTGFNNPTNMLRNADIAMYQAKVIGKRRSVQFNTSMHEKVVERLWLETDLRRAIEQHEFRLFYQPIVSLENGHIIGFEALIRWQHPERGLISPDAFIPAAVENRLISSIGRWVLREAVWQMHTWHVKFSTKPPLSISVNLSGVRFTESDLAAQIDNVLQEIGLPPSCLKLEITESVIMENAKSTISTFSELKALGVQLSIDDFGTGYSSLSYLHRFPVETLKVDRSFVSRMESNGENSAIVRTIIRLAHDLKMKVIAEGVETVEQLTQLRKLKCEYAQGYFFSKPVDSKAAEALITAPPFILDELNTTQEGN
ncbi:EAL domain-containing protein [Candidatus Poribacteria bacterium]|nr:EAL domain-containing protein [Candidatus Poribacteria bacterium]